MGIYIIIFFIFLASLGAYIRFFLSQYNSGHPWMTLLVNVFGCFLIGLFYSLKVSGYLKTGTWVLLAFAFLGALTTFSSFSLEVVKLFSEKSYLTGMTYLLLSNFMGVGLCYFGFVLGSKI